MDIKGRPSISGWETKSTYEETDGKTSDAQCCGASKATVSSVEKSQQKPSESSVKSGRSKPQQPPRKTPETLISTSPNLRVRSIEKQQASLIKNLTKENYPPPRDATIQIPGALVWSLLIVLLSCYLGWQYGVFHSYSNCTYSELQQKYPSINDDIWKSLVVGTRLIATEESESPSVFLFLHNDNNFTAQFIRDVTQETSRCFGNRRDLIKIDVEDFTSPDAMEDYGTIIQKMKDKVEEWSTILIGNLNKIPAETARSLHSICDTYTPLVKKVVIFLTLTHPNITGRTIDVAEDALVQLWGSKLESWELQPLITRITDQVLGIKEY